MNSHERRRAPPLVRFTPSCLFEICKNIELTFAKDSVEAWGILLGDQDDFDGTYNFTECKPGVFGKDFKIDSNLGMWAMDQYDVSVLARKIKKMMKERYSPGSTKIIGSYHSHPYRPSAITVGKSRLKINTIEDGLFQATPSDTDATTFTLLELEANLLAYYVELKEAKNDPQCVSKFLSFYINGQKRVYDATCHMSVWHYFTPGPLMLENRYYEGRIIYCVKDDGNWNLLTPLVEGSYEITPLGGSENTKNLSLEP